MSASTCQMQMHQPLGISPFPTGAFDNRNPSELNHSVGHISQPAGEPLGVVTHGPSPHVLGQGSKHMTAACRFGDSFQHGTHLCCPGLGKGNS